MNVLKKAFEEGMRYREYRALVDKLYQEGKATGPVQNEAMVHYTELNITRMNRWDKHLRLDEQVREQVQRIEKQQHWILLTEGWCGDAAHAVPVIAQLAEQSEQVELRLLLRDEHLPLMDQYLTNGGRGIPKLIIADEAFNEMATWGPRPQGATDLFTDGKANGVAMDEVKKQLQIWYSRDRGAQIQKEVAEAAMVRPQNA